MRESGAYGRVDRLLHRVAFRTGFAQEALSDVENLLYRSRLEPITLRDPVFVAGLPRSGSTILLNLLAETGRFASHTYRDMPFVLCPLLWNRFSQRLTTEREEPARERAHGDGLQISVDSPEAFEEIIWKRFWSEHYRSTHIVPWTPGESNSEFDEFLEHHMRKVILVRRNRPEEALRYLSKNNLNIARLAALPAPLRKGIVLVPFRDPVQQAASLLRQHRRFLKVQAEDRFVLEYMEAIGHYEFGLGLRPVDFGNWLADAPGPRSLTFWVRYWVAAYQFVEAHLGPAVRVVSYAHLTSDPKGSLVRLSETVGVPATVLASLAPRVRPPRSHDADGSSIPTETLEEATRLYERLQEQSVV